MKNEKPNWIYKELETSNSANENSRVTLSVHTHTGVSELIIEKTIIERYPVTDYNKVMDLHERLTCGRGRKVFTLEELAHKS